jgi:hypothetical protein
VGLLRYIITGLCRRGVGVRHCLSKCFILLHFGGMRHRDEAALVHRTINCLTPPLLIPRMKLLRRSITTARTPEEPGVERALPDSRLLLLYRQPSKAA